MTEGNQSGQTWFTLQGIQGFWFQSSPVCAQKWGPWGLAPASKLGEHGWIVFLILKMGVAFIYLYPVISTFSWTPQRPFNDKRKHLWKDAGHLFQCFGWSPWVPRIFLDQITQQWPCTFIVLPPFHRSMQDVKNMQSESSGCGECRSAVLFGGENKGGLFFCLLFHIFFHFFIKQDLEDFDLVALTKTTHFSHLLYNGNGERKRGHKKKRKRKRNKTKICRHVTKGERSRRVSTCQTILQEHSGRRSQSCSHPPGFHKRRD